MSGPEAGGCEDCGRQGPRLEVPWMGITGSNEGKLVCLVCAVPYVVEPGAMVWQSLADVPVSVAVAVARRVQPEAPGGWLLGVSITHLILHEGLGREGVERVMRATLDNIFAAVEKVKS